MLNITRTTVNIRQLQPASSIQSHIYNVTGEVVKRLFRMKYRNLEALVLVCAILFPSVAMAMTVQHTVDWDFAPYPSYYSDWATTKKFVAGERLFFSYDPTIHNVQQVSLRDYTTCNTTHALQEYGTGEDVLTLTNAGTYYFICGFIGHCSQGGMLMKVSVGAGPPSPPKLLPPLPPPPHHPPPHHPPPPPPHHPPPPRPRHPPPPPPPPPPSPLPQALLPPSEAPQVAHALAPGANESQNSPPPPIVVVSPNTPSQGPEMPILQDYDENYFRNETIKASFATPASAPSTHYLGAASAPRSTGGDLVAVAVVAAAVVILQGVV